MKIHHMMTPLCFLNIIFTSYVAQEVFFVKNTKILANNEEYGECETEVAINEGDLKKAKTKSGYARLSQLRSELMAAKPPNTIILHQYNYDVDRMVKEYVEPRIAELEKLEAELNPPKAPVKETGVSRPQRSRPPRPVRPPRPARPPRPPRNR